MSASSATRVVVVDPHGLKDTVHGPSCDFILASLSHGSADLRLHRYNERVGDFKQSLRPR